jgi:hypothetical protein
MKINLRARFEELTPGPDSVHTASLCGPFNALVNKVQLGPTLGHDKSVETPKISNPVQRYLFNFEFSVYLIVLKGILSFNRTVESIIVTKT